MSDLGQEGNNGTTYSYNQSGVQQVADAPERKQTVTYVDNVSVGTRYVNNEYARPAQPVPRTPIPTESAAQSAPTAQVQAPVQATPAPVVQQAASATVQTAAPAAVQPAPTVQPQTVPAQAASATPAPAVQPATTPVQATQPAPTPAVPLRATPYEASPIQAQATARSAQTTSAAQTATAPQTATASSASPAAQPASKPEQKEKKEKKKTPFILRLLAAAAFGLVFGAVAGGVILLMINLIPNKLTVNNNNPTGGPIVVSSELPSVEPVSENPNPDGNSGVLIGEGGNALNVTEVTGDMTVPEVAKECMPSIVIINTKLDYNYYGYVQEVSASGTGVIIGLNDEDLFIATNYHVVESSKEITIQFCDSSTANAEIKGKKVSADLAVVTVKLSSLGESTKNAIKLAKVGDSDALVVGESVVAIGNALGYGQSVTVGVVSALNREVTTEKGEKGVFIQTDAAINHGNSGGALLNMRGELIGINSNKLDGSSVESMGYAIPVNTARPIIESLIEKKALEELPEEEQSYFGISGATVKSGLTTQSGQPIPAGIYVTSVAPGSPADVAGIQRGDVITEFDGDSVVSTTELQTYLASYPSGAEVTVTYKRLENGVFVAYETTVTLQGKTTKP